jgi:hypothetical protein
MAIGSEPEVGVEFTTWGKMTEAAKPLWFAHMTEYWRDDLMGGYATTIYQPQSAIDRINKEWEHGTQEECNRRAEQNLRRLYDQVEANLQKPVVLHAEGV